MIYISLGSNVGNRIHHLRRAVELLKERCLYEVKSSVVLETEAILPKAAPISWNKPFLNMIVSGKTNLSPEELLQSLKYIEVEMGRFKNGKK